MGLEFALTALASVFAIVDPLGAVPFFHILTEGYSEDHRRRVIYRSCMTALLTLLTFGLAGQYIFLTFGFTIPAFQIAGGILLFLVALDMLRGERARTKPTERDREDAQAMDEVAVVPIGIPLLAGPGAITTVMVLMSTPVESPWDKVSVFAAILVTILVTYAIFHFSGTLFRRVGRVGLMAVSRVLGLILAAVGTQYVINGFVGAARLYGFLP